MMKYSRARPFSSNGGVRSPRSRPWGRLHFNAVLIVLAGMSALVIMFELESSHDGTGLIGEFKRMISAPIVEEDEELQQWWNYSSYSFEPNVSDWDEQRLTWMAEHHQNVRPRAGGKPWVMMVSGASPTACNPTILSHLLLRASKNKVDYCRMHDIEFFYNLGDPDPEFSDWWVKLPVIRMLMLQHPQVEWIWWLDADAVITDLSFEPPFAELEKENLVLHGEERQVYDRRTWTGLSTSNFMIRNCQWSLDLLDEWASVGTTASGRGELSENFQSRVLAGHRPLSEFPGDDQSSLVALLAQDKTNLIGKQRRVPMIKLVKETEYFMTANWTVVGPSLEELSQPEHEQPVPFVTHFAGCLSSCTVAPELSDQFLDACIEQLGRAFDFADNQVYKQFGFEPRRLGRHTDPYEKKPPKGVKKEFTADGEEVFRILPRYSDWDQRRLAWMNLHPPTRRDEVLLVSGSAPKSCPGKLGNHILHRGLKNLIDYSLKNDVIFFYNNAALDKDLAGWWSKLPLMKMLMIDNPGTEWIWWLDSDAVITDLDYRFDFARYNASGYNVVMYGDEHEVYEKRSYIGINTGNFLIRNCQWSLDLFDRWASFGATHELRVQNEDLLNNFLPDRPHGWGADDQCVLVYLLISEREKWGSKAGLERSIAMSGEWRYHTVQFKDEHPADERPFVTHFAGCKPCQDPTDEVGVQCLIEQDKTYNFADNQVLEQYGLRHVHLDSPKLLKRSSLVTEPEPDIEADDTNDDADLREVIVEVIDTESDEDSGEEHDVAHESGREEEQADPSEDKANVPEAKPSTSKVDTSMEETVDTSAHEQTSKAHKVEFEADGSADTMEESEAESKQVKDDDSKTAHVQEEELVQSDQEVASADQEDLLAIAERESIASNDEVSVGKKKSLQ